MLCVVDSVFSSSTDLLLVLSLEKTCFMEVHPFLLSVMRQQYRIPYIVFM